MSLGKKINEFEALPVQTLRQFNRVFEESCLEGRDCAEVEIGEIIGPANVRRLLVDGKEIVHTFNELDESTALLFGVEDRSMLVLRESGGATISTNAENENLVMQEREMALEPLEYMILQYLRGCTSPYHTQNEIAEKLGKSSRTVRTVLRDMEEKGILESSAVKSFHRIKITLKEEWA